VTVEQFDPSSLPAKTIGAGVLLRNARGEVLLVEPTYKQTWEIPGGVVESDESPREAAARECEEELGVELAIGIAACIHYAPMVRLPADGVMFVFDAGTTEHDVEDFALPPEEIRSAKFVDPSKLSEHTHPVMVARLLAAIEGAESGMTVYLER
jgi:8-oxo-dGTP diphosphatase